MNVEHPSFAQLADYLDRRLIPDQVREVEAHLGTGCPTCHADLAWLERTLTTMKDERWTEPPEWVRRRARALFAEQHPVSAPPAQRRAWPLAKRPTWPSPGGRAAVGRPPLTRWAAVALGILLVLAGLALWQSTHLPLAAAYAASLQQVSGDAQVRAAADESWHPAQNGLAVYSGAGIRTGDDGRIVLLFQGKQSATLGPDAELLIRKIGGRNGQITEIELEQIAGEVEYIIQPADVTGFYYEVITKAGEIVASRAAHCTLRVGADGTTWLAVTEGAVVVTAGGQRQTLVAGQTLMLVPGSPLITGTATPTTPTPTPLPTSPTPSPLSPTATPQPEPSETRRPEPTETEQPRVTETERPEPTETPEPQPTRTEQPEPTETERPHATQTERPEPTETEEPELTETPESQPTATSYSQPTQTEQPEPTETEQPEPTHTERPEPTRTEQPEPTETPEKPGR